MPLVRAYTNYLVYLCRCAVNRNVPEKAFPDELDFKEFYQFCYDHQLVALAYAIISKIKTGREVDQTMLIFKDKHNHEVLKDASWSYYLGMICEEFEKSGIDHVPLKGAVMKELYPMPYYRQCSDADILIRKEDADKAKALMEELGFKNESFGDLDSTDNYSIDKYMYVELHKTLVPELYKQLSSCNGILERLVPVGDHRYAMTDEDFYLSSW